jgi:hypothetical protein
MGEMKKLGSPESALLQTQPNQKNEKAPSFLISIFKLPVFHYRLHLGWLLGKRFMQITHVDRNSGKVRRTVLAVVIKLDRIPDQTHP